LVAEKRGRILIGDPRQKNMELVVYMDIPSINNLKEKGLLSLVLNPSFSDNGLFYVYYSPNSPQSYAFFPCPF